MLNPKKETTMTRLPAPEQWVLKKMTEMEVAEMIEQYIDYVDPRTGESVHLRPAFVRHFMNRSDNKLPLHVAVTTAPLVLADGSLLAPDGLDRSRGIHFEIQAEVRAAIPRREDCSSEAVREAMRFLCDDWLVDVATDYAGKCTLIAAALTIIERSLLDERPAFFVTAGRRGGGKTTALKMMIIGATGILPAASAWSDNEEERRKALLSHFIYGAAYILWDNIKRGSTISCPHIERSCTAKYYSDRKLGVSEVVSTAASTVHFFTGNNIGPRGDLASRSLYIRIIVDRPDPENRDFKHPDPIGWTYNHRTEIVRALYTILLGNLQLKTALNTPSKTRFKMWWRLAGSAVEYAATLHNTKPEDKIDFQNLFIKQEEEEDEESLSLADALEMMQRKWPKGFHATEVAVFIQSFSDDNAVVLRDFLYPGARPGFVATAKSVGKQLKKRIDEPVRSGNRILVLKRKKERADTTAYDIIVKVTS
jgi:hypothetical protein